MAHANLNVEPKDRPGARGVAVEEAGPWEGAKMLVDVGTIVPYPDPDNCEGWLAFDETAAQLGGVFSCDSLAIRALEHRRIGKRQEEQAVAAERKSKALVRALAAVEAAAIETGDGESEAVKRATEIAIAAWDAEPADVNRAIDRGLATFAAFADKPEPDDPSTLDEPCEACGKVPPPDDSRIDLALEACPDCGAAVCPDCLTDDGNRCKSCDVRGVQIAELETALRLVLAIADNPASNPDEPITLAPKTRAQILAALGESPQAERPSRAIDHDGCDDCRDAINCADYGEEVACPACGTVWSPRGHAGIWQIIETPNGKDDTP